MLSSSEEAGAIDELPLVDDGGGGGGGISNWRITNSRSSSAEAVYDRPYTKLAKLKFTKLKFIIRFK